MTDIQSVSVVVQSDRGQKWAKVSRMRQASRLPLPSNVQGGNDLPGEYLPTGDEELLPGDAIFEGSRGRHGWEYSVTLALENGRGLFISPRTNNLADLKAEMKAAGLPFKLLQGAGPLAALVRVVWGYRLGLPFPSQYRLGPEAHPKMALHLLDKEADARLVRVIQQPEKQGS